MYSVNKVDWDVSISIFHHSCHDNERPFVALQYRSNYVVCQFIVRDTENLINFCSRFTIEYLQSSNYRGTFTD